MARVRRTPCQALPRAGLRPDFDQGWAHPPAILARLSWQHQVEGGCAGRTCLTNYESE